MNLLVPKPLRTTNINTVRTTQLIENNQKIVSIRIFVFISDILEES